MKGKLSASMLMYMMLNSKQSKDVKGPLDGIDIESEYELIQQKKSKLPANTRAMVVEAWEVNCD